MAHYIPSWAASPARPGQLYLEVLPQAGGAGAALAGSGRWCVDRKPGYLLGRNADVVDIGVAHQSASRVHACIAHDAMGDLYLVDLGGVHGEPAL